MKKYIAMSRSQIDKILKANETIAINLLVTRINIPIPQRSKTVVTRKGYDSADKSPFYTMDHTILSNYYYGYEDTVERKNMLLYADVIPIKTEGLEPIGRKFLKRDDVKVVISSRRYKLPDVLEPHRSASLRIFKKMGKINRDDETKVWENNVSLRLDDIEGATFECSFAEYFDQVGTNLTLDWKSDELGADKVTVRSAFEKPVAGKLVPLQDSVLANTFGTAIVFYNNRMQPLLRIRNPDMGSIGHNGLHCTVSGVLELPENTGAGEFGFDILLPGTVDEIRSELGLEPHQYRIFPVAIARELPRGGKPQIFWIAIADVEDQIIEEAAKKAKERKEFLFEDDSATFVPQPDKDGSYVEKFTYEGLAALNFCEMFIRANRDKLC